MKQLPEVIMEHEQVVNENQPKSKSRRLLLKLLGTGAALSSQKLLGQQQLCPEDAEWLIDKALNLQDSVSMIIYRPLDLLFLELTYINFEKRDGNFIARKGSGPAYLIANFQPQSIAEEAFLENGGVKQPGEKDISIKNGKLPFLPKAYISGKSRLVYDIPASVKQINLTAAGLLEWSAYTLKVNKRAAAPNRLILWDPNDDKPIQIKPIKDIIKSVDTTGKPVLRKVIDIITPKNQNQQPSIEQQKASKPVQIMRGTPRDTTATRTMNMNQANRIATKDEQLQIAATQQPAREITRQQQQNDGGIVAAYQNITQGKSPLPPDPLDTSIEAPWRLFLSPSNIESFAHSYKLKLWDLFKGKNLQVFELWHTRLAGLNEKGKVEESDTMKSNLTMRALWGVDICADPMGKPERNFYVLNPPKRTEKDFFQTAMYNDDRHCIVHETSNWALSNYTPKAIQVHRMMMSTLGAWLDADLIIPRKNLEKAKAGSQLAFEKLNLVKWSHISTMARDHYVEIVYAGNMFPFGHEASLVRITERKPVDGYAANLQRTFIVINEVEKSYNPYSRAKNFMSFPFTKVRFITTITPNLDSAEKFVTGLPGNNEHQYMPKANGQPVRFKMLAIDPEGEEVDFVMPLVFVAPDVFMDVNKLQKVIDEYNKYDPEKLSFGMTEKIQVYAELRGQKLALAQSLVPGDTSFEAERITFFAQKTTDEIQGFLPGVAGVRIHEPSYQALISKREAIEIGLIDDKAAGNTAGVFAEFKKKPVINFSGNTDKSGGGISPNFNLTGLSKLQGAFGGMDIGKMKNLSITPTDFFAGGAGEAKLFGVLKLADLVSFTGVGSLVNGYVAKINAAVTEIRNLQSQIAAKQEMADNAGADALKATLKQKTDELVNKTMAEYQAKIPQLKTFDTPGDRCTQYLWKAEGKDYSTAGGFLKFNALDKPNTIQLNTLLRRPKNGDLPVMSTTASINKFNFELANIIRVNFDRVYFGVSSKAKVDVGVDMKKGDTMTFLGPLSFINKLKDIIPADGFSDPPFLDVTTEGVKTGYTLAVPDVQVGAFTLSHLSLGAMVNLPFTGAPMTLRFNFCERQQPFTLTVSALGGGGFFALELDLKGLRMLEVSLEFGAAAAINLGVASGAVSIMAGIYFKMKIESGNNIVELTGYVRINGALSVLGLITASVQFYLGLTYNFTTEKAWGEATLKIKVEVLFFSKTVSLTTRREFKGSGNDPNFKMMISEADWKDYCAAFAA
jgi:hypothetical protein